MAAGARSGARRGVPRRAWRCALAIASTWLATGAAHAQVAATLGVESQNRYRGTATDDRGPVLRASVMADSPWAATSGLYAGASGLWRTRDGGLSELDALAGWSGRFADLGPWKDVDPRWGWDVGVRRAHYGAGSRYDFTEAMAGLLAPEASLRVWMAPHYFGSRWSSVYLDLSASHALDAHWQLVGHVGRLRYGAVDGAHLPGRTDALAGVAWTHDRWNVRLTRDGLLSGHVRDDTDHRARAAWVLGASLAF